LDDKEIDFVAEKSDQKTYVQVSYMISEKKTHEREFGNLLKIQDNWRKIVVSMDEFTGSPYKGIEHWYFRDFRINFQ
jgi:predicted AAA+ superfamily ATPase